MPTHCPERIDTRYQYVECWRLSSGKTPSYPHGQTSHGISYLNHRPIVYLAPFLD
ncbi:Uncharacterised protein [Vibrio cholerae]|nr:Uncharacterised protein [Vibrio cholerae]